MIDFMRLISAVWKPNLLSSLCLSYMKSTRKHMRGRQCPFYPSGYNKCKLAITEYLFRKGFKTYRSLKNVYKTNYTQKTMGISYNCILIFLRLLLSKWISSSFPSQLKPHLYVTCTGETSSRAEFAGCTHERFATFSLRTQTAFYLLLFGGLKHE